MKVFLRLVSVSMVAFIVLAGCTSIPLPLPTPEQSPLITVSPIPPGETADPAPEAPVPSKGKASVSGILYSTRFSRPIAETAMYLIPYREDLPLVLIDPNAEEGDYRTDSDGAGAFAITDVEPGQYYIVVWAPYNWVLATESPESETPLVVTVAPDEQKPLGRLNLLWP